MRTRWALVWTQLKMNSPLVVLQVSQVSETEMQWNLDIGLGGFERMPVLYTCTIYLKWDLLFPTLLAHDWYFLGFPDTIMNYEFVALQITSGLKTFVAIFAWKWTPFRVNLSKRKGDLSFTYITRPDTRWASTLLSGPCDLLHVPCESFLQHFSTYLTLLPYVFSCRASLHLFSWSIRVKVLSFPLPSCFFHHWFHYSKWDKSIRILMVVLQKF